VDKRKTLRTKFRVKIKVGMDTVFTDGLTTDVSKKGLAFVSKHSPKSKGVVIAMENGGKITPLVGKCCYVKSLRKGSCLLKIGVELVTDSDDFEELIENLELEKIH